MNLQNCILYNFACMGKLRAPLRAHTVRPYILYRF